MLCFLISGSIIGQENHLDKRISIHFDQIELGELIYKIGETGGFQFSYNAKIIEGRKLVSYQGENQTVRVMLNDLLGLGYEYRVIGNHIIILEEKANTKITKEERKRDYVITGFIVDIRTGEKIYEASIYEVEGRKISATDRQGFYSLNLSKGDQERYLNYSKVGYLDTVILVRPLEEQMLNIALRPLPSPSGIAAMAKAEPVKFNMHETPFVAALVPSKAVAMADNVQVIERRFAQISFLPFLGSNRFVSGMLTNRFSLNVFAGYSGGVNGLEIGGFLNMNRKDMLGMQFAGFGNIVGGKTAGIQGAGFFNVTAGKMSGIQMAGFANVAIDTIQGIQLSGFANVLRGGMKGSQIAGFVNFTSKNVDGLQIAGFTNIAIKDVKFGQISGFANFSRDVGGVQIAGFTNMAAGTNRAIQVAGFLNYATDLHGIQLSIFNVADTVSAGIPIGFFSFVRKGFHPLEVSIDELFPLNLSFKTGINAFYNAFSAGIQKDLAYVGYGVGSQGYLTKRFSLGLEVHARAIVNVQDPIEIMGLQNQLKATFNYKFAKHFSLTTGPSFNVLISDNNYPQSSDFLIPNLFPLSTEPYGLTELTYWFGWSFGIRL